MTRPAENVGGWPDWQPIETAPRDGTWIIAVWDDKHPTTGEPYYPAIVRWHLGCWDDDHDDPVEEDLWPFTHWMMPPLPPALLAARGDK